MTLLQQPLFHIGQHYVTVLGLIAFVGFFAAGLIIARFLQSQIVRRFLSRFKIDTNFIAIVTTILSLAPIIFFTVTAENAGIHLAALAVFAGAVGVGVGFGLQNIASNFISGLVILAERPITIGDRVEVAGILGTVRQIRARSTVIVTNDNIAIIVPNSKFIDSPVTNWQYGDPTVRFRLPVGVAYGSDVNKVREALIAAAREHSATLNDPEPTAFLEKFGDSTIDFELVAWTQEMSYKPRRFRSDLNFLIYKHLTAAGIEIPNPQRDLHIRDGVIKVEGTEVGTPR